ncbi:MAG: peptidase [Massilia sp.]|nr:peptidase [Massilia sp.]
MRKLHLISILTLAVASVVTTQAFAAEETVAALTAAAKITEAQAKTTALAKVPHATVKSAELEREHGLLVWSFDLSQPSVKGVTEVQVDAKSGKIVSVKKETPAQETKEAKAEKAEKHVSK